MRWGRLAVVGAVALTGACDVGIVAPQGLKFAAITADGGRTCALDPDLPLDRGGGTAHLRARPRRPRLVDRQLRAVWMLRALAALALAEGGCE